MAIDSENKRSSCIGIDLIWMRVYPKPDGSLNNANDRQQIGMKYAGTLGGAPPPAAVAPYRTLLGMGV